MLKKVIAILAIIIFAFLISGCSLFQKSTSFFKVSTLPKEVSQSIVGTYEFVKDSDGSKPKSNAKITISFQGNGVAILKAEMLDEKLQDVGEYEIANDKITILLPTLDKEAKAADFKLEGQELTLPFLVINSGKGSSIWKKITYADNPAKDAQLYLQYLLLQKEELKSAVQKTADFLKKQQDIDNVFVSTDNKNITIDFSSGLRQVIFSSLLAPVGLVDKKADGSSSFWDIFEGKAYAQFFPGSGNVPSREGILRTKYDAWLDKEPEPLALGDAPNYKTALILAPTFSQFSPYRSGESGEATATIDSNLRAIDYQVDGPYTDTNHTFSIKEYVKFFTKSEPYGVIYWSSHGGLVNEGSGDKFHIFLGINVGQETDSQQVLWQKFNKYLNRQFVQIPRRYQRARQHLALNSNGEIIASSEFFKVLNPKLSKSLVYIDACEAATNSDFRKALKPKVFVGFATDPSAYLTASLASDFFKALTRKTRTSLEAYDFAMNSTADRKSKDFRWERLNLKRGIKDYKHYMADSDAPAKLLSSNVRGMLMQARAYTARQATQDLRGTAQSLQDCLNQYWSKGESAALVHQFCYDAQAGEPYPNAEEVEEAIGILTGYKDSRARFTLIEN